MRKINKEFAEVMMTKPEGRMIEQLTVSKPQAHDRLYRAVATGPVSPVSTGPLFPSPMACLASPVK